MKYAYAAAAFAASVSAQAVTQSITPAGGLVCSANYPGTFLISVVNANMKRQVQTQSDDLMLTLSNGILMDNKGRTGYIASNHQFQFDGPPQAGAIYTAGFSACSNGSLALESAVFYKCDKGDTYDLYDTPAETHCSPIYLDIIPASDTTGSAPMSGATAMPTELGDGQVGATSAASVAPVTTLTDGQPQGTAGAAPVTELTDGQPVGTAGPAPSMVVTELGDGQPQVPTGAPVTELGDGQPQAPTGAPNATSSLVPFAGSASHSGISLLPLGAAAVAVAFGAIML